MTIINTNNYRISDILVTRTLILEDRGEKQLSLLDET